MNFCAYGCNKIANYQLKNSKWCCSESWNKCSAIREKNSDGLKKAYSEGLREKKDIPEKAKGWNKGKTIYNDQRISSTYDISKLFSENSPYDNWMIRKIIIQEGLKEYKCEICNITEWNKNSISLELDHINGNRRDHRLNNLRFLCPNCHSQTANYKGRNRGKNKNISDEEFLKAYNKSNNIRQILLNLGLAPKGGNYKVVRQKVAKLNLDPKEKGIFNN